jgi:hypothetical protein
VAAAGAAPKSMIRKSGSRFSEKIMLNKNGARNPAKRAFSAFDRVYRPGFSAPASDCVWRRSLP